MKQRKIDNNSLRETMIDLIYQASFTLPPGVDERYSIMKDREESYLARNTMQVIMDNSRIAREMELPLCQDCGIVMVFLEVGQSALFEGDLPAVINGAVEEAYFRFNLRKSVVADPLIRVNTGTNTPAFIHTDIVPGDRVSLTVYLKGGGSENMTSLRMFRPTDPVEAIIDHIEERVVDAGPNPCPPIFLGIGIGGTADTALINAKKAVLRGVGTRNADPFYAELESRIEDRLNASNVGPLGFGGVSTVGGVFILQAPTHIATLPVALNMNCHSLRYRRAEL